NVGGVLFFVAHNGPGSYDLWKSDGTTAGSMIVKTFAPGGFEPGPGGLTEMNGILYFGAEGNSAGDELWRSDGTLAGTVMVKDINPTGGNGTGSFPDELTNAGGTLFFSADDGSHGKELWKSDGTAAGTVMIKDITPGAAGSIYAPFGNPTLASAGG